MKIAYCGNDCDACPRLRATASADHDLLGEVAALWHRLGFRDRIESPGEIACRGCFSSRDCRYGIRACVTERDAGHCVICGEYPCGKLQAAFEKTDRFAAALKGRCTDEEYQALTRAFFDKRGNLERLRAEAKKRE